MSEHGIPTIPYERQSDSGSARTCGAAALRMVYASLADERNALGMPDAGDLSQSAIWERISKENRLGVAAGATHLMVRDALSRGYSAVALQATHPLQLLLACKENGIRAILNHRLRADGPAGHFTVFLDMDEKGVLVHDPTFGPSRRLAFPELLELWQPRTATSEIIGNLLIGIALRPPRVTGCRTCAVPIPDDAPCPRCRAGVPLAPSALVGCVGPRCVARSWLRVCCPACDYTFPFAGSAPAADASGIDGLWNLGPLFAEIDRFQAHVRRLPEALGREDVRQQLASLDALKATLRLSEQEELAARAEAGARAAQRKEAVLAETEEIRSAREAAARPGPPLDGNALAAQLLRDLGIVK